MPYTLFYWVAERPKEAKHEIICNNPVDFGRISPDYATVCLSIYVDLELRSGRSDYNRSTD